jgi:putative NIF3 family GTP cyclohydrolase 1 type 2
MLENPLQTVGAGMLGELTEPVDTTQFINQIKKTFGGFVRHTSITKSQIKTVALCGGSGSFLLQDAIRANADIFISSDFKYHQFFDADQRIIIADIGHFENEQFTIPLIHRFLKEKFPKFAVHLTTILTNPIHYV